MYYRSGHVLHQQTALPGAYFFDQFLEFPFAALALFGDLHLFILREVIKQGVNQRGEPDAVYVHRQ